MATERWIRRLWHYVWPILLAIAVIGVTLVFVGWISGCSLHLHVGERHSHYSGEPPASVTAEERILNAFGVDNAEETLDE